MKRLLFGTTLLVLFLALGIFWWKTSLKPVSSTDPALVIFTVLNGQGIRDISRSLKSKGLIRNQIAFFLLIRKLGLGNKIQAGDYQLTASMSSYEIAGELTHGTSDVWITVPEGLRGEEVVKILSDKLKAETFPPPIEEGYWFPDTYRFPKETALGEAIKIMRDNFDKNFRTLDLNETNLEPEEIVILASIVEREAKYDQDRPVVAGILLKRLKSDWPLEADATVQYALGYDFENETWWRKNLTSENLKIDSLYNTRKYKGLPPGPICNPGLKALESVVKPQETDDWFYLSDKTGKMHYARTLEEHNLNIAEYL